MDRWMDVWVDGWKEIDERWTDIRTNEQGEDGWVNG